MDTLRLFGLMAPQKPTASPGPNRNPLALFTIGVALAVLCPRLLGQRKKGQDEPHKAGPTEHQARACLDLSDTDFGGGGYATDAFPGHSAPDSPDREGTYAAEAAQVRMEVQELMGEWPEEEEEPGPSESSGLPGGPCRLPRRLSSASLASVATMCRDPSVPYVLPPRRKGDDRKYTVVLDLDETLVYGREGPIFMRPGLAELMDFLGQHCETVVWTAGERDYAQRIIKVIDPKGIIEHCIYRHRKWYNGVRHWKDLSLCGRDIDRTILIDNMPHCIRGQAIRAVLVSDFWGGDGAGDPTLYIIRNLIRHLVSSGMSVREYLPQSSLVCSVSATTDDDGGGEMYFYCLDVEAAAALEDCDMPVAPLHQSPAWYPVALDAEFEVNGDDNASFGSDVTYVTNPLHGKMRL